MSYDHAPDDACFQWEDVPFWRGKVLLAALATETERMQLRRKEARQAGETARVKGLDAYIERLTDTADHLEEIMNEFGSEYEPTARDLWEQHEEWKGDALREERALAKGDREDAA